jgi:hypothetical protein
VRSKHITPFLIGGGLLLHALSRELRMRAHCVRARTRAYSAAGPSCALPELAARTALARNVLDLGPSHGDLLVSKRASILLALSLGAWSGVSCAEGSASGAGASGNAPEPA